MATPEKRKWLSKPLKITLATLAVLVAAGSILGNWFPSREGTDTLRSRVRILVNRDQIAALEHEKAELSQAIQQCENETNILRDQAISTNEPMSVPEPPCSARMKGWIERWSQIDDQEYALKYGPSKAREHEQYDCGNGCTGGPDVGPPSGGNSYGSTSDNSNSKSGGDEPADNN